MKPADLLASIGQRFALDAIYVFGSRARDVHAFVTGAVPLDPGNRSDVDIGVLPRTGTRLDARQRVDLAADLEGLFGVARVDLVVLPEAPALLAADVVSGELLFVSDATREAEYQLHALRRAADLAPFERERRSIVMAGGR